MSYQKREIENWLELRKELKGKGENQSAEWNKAVEILKDRLEKKFLNPINAIITNGINEGEGFTVVTIQCLLIEFLALFRKGMIFDLNKTPNAIYYKSSSEVFTTFLIEVTPFNVYFIIPNAGNKYLSFYENKKFNAYDFYSSVRRGLMHEARTKGKWVINSNKTTPPFRIKAGKYSVERTVLNVVLNDYIKTYLHMILRKEVEHRQPPFPSYSHPFRLSGLPACRIATVWTHLFCSNVR